MTTLGQTRASYRCLNGIGTIWGGREYSGGFCRSKLPLLDSAPNPPHTSRQHAFSPWHFNTNDNSSQNEQRLRLKCHMLLQYGMTIAEKVRDLETVVNQGTCLTTMKSGLRISTRACMSTIHKPQEKSLPLEETARAHSFSTLEQYVYYTGRAVVIPLS